MTAGSTITSFNDLLEFRLEAYPEVRPRFAGLIDAIRHLHEGRQGPPRVMVAGRFNSGKSQLIRGLLGYGGGYVLPVDGAECTPHLFFLEHGPKVAYWERNEMGQEALDKRRFGQVADASILTREQREALAAGPVRTFVIEVPSPFLINTRLIDTIGTNGVTAGSASRAREALLLAATAADMCLLVIEPPGLGEDVLQIIDVLGERIRRGGIAFVLNKTDLVDDDSVRLIVEQGRGDLWAHFKLEAPWFSVSAEWQTATPKRRQALVDTMVRDGLPPIHDWDGLAGHLTSLSTELEDLRSIEAISRWRAIHQAILDLESGYSQRKQAAFRLLNVLPMLRERLVPPLGPQVLASALTARAAGKHVPWEVLSNFGIDEETLAPRIEIRSTFGRNVVDHCFADAVAVSGRQAERLADRNFLRVLADIEGLEHECGAEATVFRRHLEHCRLRLAPLSSGYEYERSLASAVELGQSSPEVLARWVADTREGLVRSITGTTSPIAEPGRHSREPTPLFDLDSLPSSRSLYEDALAAARSARNGRRLDEAMKCLARASLVALDLCDSGPPRAIALQELARCAVEVGRPEDAVWYAREAVSCHAFETEIRLTLVEALIADRQYDEALVQASHLVGIAEHDPRAHSLQGRAHLELEEFEESEACYRHALEQEGCQASARVGLGASLFGQGRFREAEAELRRAARARSKDPLAHVWLGATLVAQKRYVDAIATLDRALILDDSSPEAMLWKSRALMGEMRFEDAESQLGRCLAIVPARWEARLDRSKCLQRLGRYGEALAQAQLAMEGYPQSSDVRDALEDAELAVRLLGHGDLSERAIAATAIGRAGRIGGVLPLFDALAQPMLWEPVIEALLDLLRAGQPVLASAKDRCVVANPNVWAGAMRLIGAIGGDECGALARTGTKSPAPLVRLEAANALVRLLGATRAMDDLTRMYREDELNRAAIVGLLAASNNARAVPSLSDCVIQSRAGYGVALAALLRSDDRRVVPALIEVVATSAARNERRDCMHRLAALKAVESIATIADQTYWADESWQLVTVEALGRFRHRLAVVALTEVLHGTTAAATCRDAARALGMQGDNTVIPDLRKRLKNCEWLFDHGSRQALRDSIAKLGG